MIKLLIMGLTIGSCAPMVHQPMKTSFAKLGDETPKFSELTALPPPKEKIIAAVYKFRDQTGQYKLTETGANWSTAVTQGATSILIRSMEESGWFVPIEREGLPNLLNERKIIRSSRATYGTGETQGADLLPPLLYAGVLLEGGIISFDSNVLTGGAGARYLGISSSGQYREDRVTIYLRAVSTVNGKILKTIYTSKTILSQKVDVGVFRFVAPKKLLEAEAGFTYNEPSEMAVREAIEQAIIGLVIEGIEEGLWATNTLSEKDSTIIKNYNLERANKQVTDQFGTPSQIRRSHFGVNASLGGNQLKGDYTAQQFNPGAQFGAEIFADKPVSFGFNLFYGNVGADNAYKGSLIGTNFTVNYRMLPYYRATPYLKMGVGFFDEVKSTKENTDGFNPISHFNATAAFGIEYMIVDRFSVFSQLSYTKIFQDNLDGIAQGKYDDYLINFSIGTGYYLRRKQQTN
jgi:curli production assembly/transport component CsgG